MEENRNLKFYAVSELPQMAVYGRTVEGADPLPLFWNHSGVEIGCDGSELWIEVETDCSFHEPWIATELNGCLMSRMMLLPEGGNIRKICLFRSMTPGQVKYAKFYRELQAMGEDDATHILVRGYWTDGNLLPVPEKSFRIEMIGDSITSGEGTYGATPDTDWLAMYMSSSRHYGTIIEKALNADVRVISQGGWGVYCGWDNDVRHNIPSIYEPVCGLATGAFNEKLGAQKPYDFSWQPQVVIINLGTNDCSAFSQPPFPDPDTGIAHKQHLREDGSFEPADAQKVEDAVVAFLQTLRGHYPKAHLIWTYGMLGYDLTPVLSAGVNRYRKESGDSNCVFLNIPDTLPEDYGSHMHPGYASHEKAAQVLIRYISGKFGLTVKPHTGNL